MSAHRPDKQDDYLKAHPTLRDEASVRQSQTAWFAATFEPYLPSSKQARILEIGPGYGEGLRWLAEQKGFSELRAIDTSAEAVNHCNKIRNVQAVLVEDSPRYLLEHPGVFDVIIMNHVLEHFPKPDVVSMLDACRQALAVGGTLLVVVPNVACPIIGPEQQFFDFTHETAFSPWSLEHAFRISQFRPCEVLPVWPPPDGIGRWIQRYLQKTILAAWRLYLRIFAGQPRPVLTHSMLAVAYRSESQQ